ncbi:aldehyde-activating protein [Aurantiacibacter luteus]|uniref:Aldehyde-activating protein n=1 Tax=Aurantiacibacter luteus TaxID=1581420 RepID=A0A0G9MZK6_9SPHN|nr:aldehyde-activating protein [Aurantiacibacter luteus]
MEGHCLCGAIRVILLEPKQAVELCHCDMCRRWGGAFYSALSGKDYRIDGEDKLGVYRSSDWATRDFCTVCGSHIGYSFLPAGTRSFLAGLFDDAHDLPIEKEIFVDEKPRWCDLSGNHPCQTGAEVIAEAEAAGYSFD